jgi:NAD(P)-dependent dehydrogenase (short-subunit alcohol dehydrogenase family)
LQSNVALSKLGTPQDIARLVAYLASPISSFATGAVWNIDGGQVRA